MAAREDQFEALVLDHGLVDLIHGRLRRVQQLGLLRKCPLAADTVDCPVACRHEQPRSRVRRHAVGGPALGGDRECVLGGFLGKIEIAEEADQRREHAAPLLAEDAVQQGYCSTTGRTSIAPPSRAAGIRPASSIA